MERGNERREEGNGNTTAEENGSQKDSNQNYRQKSVMCRLLLLNIYSTLTISKYLQHF